MTISSDVNVIFGYIDDTDLFHIPVLCFLAPYNRKDNYLLLDEVKVSFIHTYSYFLKNVCSFIEKSIILQEYGKQTKLNQWF